MKGLEIFVRGIKGKLRIGIPGLNYLLGEANTLIQEVFGGGIHRRLNGLIDISLAARFRTISEQYEPLAFRIMGEILKPGSFALDIGANIGLYTLAMAKLVGPHGKVVSFEPASESFQALLDHVRRNSLGKIVEAHMLVVGNKAGNCQFIDDGVLGTNRVGDSLSQRIGAKIVKRRVVTLDQIFCGDGSLPDFIKIDVEGYEMDVLEGAQKILTQKRCPILCELHPGYWRGMNLNPNNLIRLTEELGYNIFDLTGNPCFDFENRKIVLLRTMGWHTGRSHVLP
ncbi:MAG: FkbM family methyltransferase [Thermodesulfobacteriota bacterium]|jgi:FkbM family methyltransferase